MKRSIAVFGLTAIIGHAAGFPADSARGRQLFDTLSCVQCHAVAGKGGSIGPDLGRVIDRGFTPARLAATMWNHAPAMWAAMRQQGIRAGDMNDQAAADLFAYFYSARFFEAPGDAARGKRAFESKHCAVCHGMATSARPLSQWTSTGQPMALAAAMWNHGALMRDEFAKHSIKWPDLTSQDLTDLLVYARNLRGAPASNPRLEISSGAEGEALFQSKGCAECHVKGLVLSQSLKGKTLTGIAAAMWDHQPRMAVDPQPLTTGEMQEITSYLWAARFFEDEGDSAAGRRVFNSKRCAACHDQAAGNAPKLAGRTFSGITMVSALWHHGPQMLDQMKATNISWPRFDGTQMSDLIAFLNFRNGSKP
jgi:cytochrome c2